MGNEKYRIWLEVPKLTLSVSMSPWVNEAGTRVRAAGLRLKDEPDNRFRVFETDEYKYPNLAWSTNPGPTSYLLKTRIVGTAPEDPRRLQKYGRILTGFEAPAPFDGGHSQRETICPIHGHSAKRAIPGTSAREVEGAMRRCEEDEWKATEHNELLALYLVELSIIQDALKNEWPGTLSGPETANLLEENWHRGDRGFTEWVIQQVEGNNEFDNRGISKLRIWIEFDYTKAAEIRASIAGLHATFVRTHDGLKLLVQTNEYTTGQDLNLADYETLITGHRAILPYPEVLNEASKLKLTQVVHRDSFTGDAMTSPGWDLLAYAEKWLGPDEQRLLQLYVHAVAEVDLFNDLSSLRGEDVARLLIQFWSLGDVGFGSAFREWASRNGLKADNSDDDDDDDDDDPIDFPPRPAERSVRARREF